MITRICICIGLVITPVAYAQVPIYKTIRTHVEEELPSKKADLNIQRFTIGIYYDNPVETTDATGNKTTFEMKEEEYVDLSLQDQVFEMCGKQEGRTNQYITCVKAQKRLKQLVERNTWIRRLGRDMQVIASGYEAGIEGYPGKVVDVISKFAGITHLWRATNDPFVSPILEVLTRARPWPEGRENEIKGKSSEIRSLLDDLKTSKGEGDSEKEDLTEYTAAIWRYRHGIRYIHNNERESCEETNTRIRTYFNCLQGGNSDAECSAKFGNGHTDPSMIMLQRRWCDIEDKLIDISNILAADRVEVGNEEDIIYPSFVDGKSNLYLWMRKDDVGLQPLIPLEPVHATLWHPDYGNCIEEEDIRSCYNRFTEFIIRGGKYPSKLGSGLGGRQPSIMGGGTPISISGDADESIIRKYNSVVKEPETGQGICSHPFGRRGYLCRNIEYEACDITQQQQDQLADAGTGGIILTGCEPERFNGDVARRVSGSNICGIGGWRETVPENIAVDTPKHQPDMQVPACSKCWVDIVCQDSCDEGNSKFALTKFEKRNNGVIDICVPNEPDTFGGAFYLVAHELIHAQQICNESNLQSLDRGGLLEKEQTSKESAAACCASEREAYFVQCKLMALDGALDKAGITIDQCASAYANFSCAAHDENPKDDNYVCTNDGVDPKAVSDAINSALESLQDTLNLPTTCAAAMNHPRIRALYNSMPSSCSPGCEIQYQNTIGNNLCYTGQCIEETHEFARDIPGKMPLTEIDQGFPWDACEKPDPQLGAFEVPPALSGPKFPLYRPALLLQQLDTELCQINGLPASTPPILCGFDPRERLGLPPFSLMQTANDLLLQPAEYDATGLGIQYAAAAIGSRVTTDMFIQYLKPSVRHFADLLNTMYDVFNSVGDLEFPNAMCPRYTDNNFSCSDLE